jgi:regulator of replication initiation timing
MKATVNLNQILQGGLAGLVAWLFKTVNDLQQEVAVLMVQISDAKEDLMNLAMREQELNSAITEILIKLGG